MQQPVSEAALDAWLNQDSNRELNADYSDWKLDPVRDALNALQLSGLPRPITVAGTKGKGSTVAFLETILVAHGRTCFAFTSPHVTNLRERWRLNGQAMELAAIARHCPRVQDAIQQSRNGAGKATYFERSFLLACCIVAELQADFICEVGLGGRLDCANVLDAGIVCLSSLGLDHTNVLGPTIAHIAREKLGVCRPDAPLFISAQSSAATAAIAANLPPQVQAIHVPPLDPAMQLPLGLPGAHQRANAANALAAAAQYLGPNYDQTRAHGALARASLPARCQVLHDGERRYIVDGAHTSESMAATIAFADEYFGQFPATSLHGPNWGMIFGVASDKDIAAITQVLPHIPILRCGYAWGRCADKENPAWPASCLAWPWAQDIRQALNHPILSQRQNILISGSFYLAGEALELLHPTCQKMDLPSPQQP